MKHLVIVESPTKARTIGKFLGADYEIKASMGHVMDLPKSTLGVDVEHNFSPQYEMVEDKRKIVLDLKSAANKASSIILATDPDREGEAIASHVKDVLGSSSKFKVQSSKFQRIIFHEITKGAIEEALGNPRSINDDLVDAQTARRVLDRLVGYKLSPLLWKKVRRGLSAGRVQSVALRLIVEREREIEKFVKEKYWTITVLLARGPVSLHPHPTSSVSLDKLGIPAGARRGSPALATPRVDEHSVDFDLVEINGEKIEVQSKFDLYDGEYKTTKTLIDNEEKAKEIENDLKTKQFVVSDVAQKEMSRSPHPPFTTSTLQQEAARRFGMIGKKTMILAQKLYEEGFITYHRTDSVIISVSALQSIRSFINKEYGEKYLPEKPRFYTTKQKLAQEAHEAIRPTAVGQISNIKYQVSSSVGNDGWKLYELIWRRAVASQMRDALIESTTVLVDTVQNTQKTQYVRKSDNQSIGKPESEYRFKTTGTVLVFDGFLKINPQALQDKNLPDFRVSDQLDLLKAYAETHETQPPPRYNDASLIKTLEEKGIGRPSTYATIVSTIESRQYIERTEGRFTPTPVGTAVNDFLVANFSDVDDIPFTASLEDELDEIAHGQKKWVPVIKEFYGPFSKKLDQVKDVKRVQIEVEKTNEICEKCKAPMVVRIGRFGKFLSCSKFPQCDFSKPFVQETKFICPKDHGKIIIKKTRRGRIFYGCSNYPSCDFAAWNLRDIQAKN